MGRTDKKDNKLLPEEDNFDEFPSDQFDAFPEDGQFIDTPSASNEQSIDSSLSSMKDIKFKDKEIAVDVNDHDQDVEKIIAMMKAREEELIKRVGILQYSFAVGVRNAVTAGCIGGIVGIFSGAVEARRQNLPSGSYMGHVAGSGLANSASFGGFLGAYTGIKCYMRLTRQKNDLINSFTAGSIAGMVGTLRTRNPSYILMSGVSSGALMAAIDSFSPDSK